MWTKKEILAPFTPEQIDYFNNIFQKKWHWYTCCSPEDIQECLRAKWLDNWNLVAEESWLICPCKQYTQKSFIDFFSSDNDKTQTKI